MTVEHSNGNGNYRRPPPRGTPQPTRVLPHDLECEASILGGILLRDEWLAELAELEIEDFYHHPHRAVFEAMRNLAAAGRPIDVVMLEHELERRGVLSAVGGIAFLGELSLKVPTVDNVRAYADVVLRLSRNRRAILELSSALERAYNWPHDPSELVAETVGQLARFDAERPQMANDSRARWCVTIESYLGDEEPDDNDAEDWVLRDLIPRAEPCIWGGPMKGGKTWAAMDMLIAIALGEAWAGFENTIGQPTRAMGFFLEDNRRRITKRLAELCRARNRSLLTDPVLREHMRVTRTPFRMPDRGEQRALAAEIKRWGARVVFVDNLTRVMIGDPNNTRDASNFTRAWVELGEETGAAFVFLHHTKKPIGDQKAVDPFDSLRGSNDFGAAARNMIVTTPLRIDNGELLAEVRMRGNLDLRCDSFALGFERWPSVEWGGKHCAKLVPKGDIDKIKTDATKARKERKEREKRDDKAAEFGKRKARALELLDRDGHVSMAMLAIEFGLSPNAMRPVFQHLVQSGVVKEAGKRGYVRVEDNEPRQEGLGL